MKPNTQFKLSVRDLELIEMALLNMEQTPDVRALLGKLHNQKNWYRPKDGTYISG